MILTFAALAAGVMGCGGGEGKPLQIVINVSSQCETTSSGSGGEASTTGSSTSSASGTGGAGGSGGTESTTSSSSGSTTGSSSSTSGTGGGGGAPCVPTKCGALVCGQVDDGCGTPLDCGGCDGDSGPQNLATCNQATNLCVCTSAANIQQAVDFCKTGLPGIPAGTVPMFCGPFPVSPKVGVGCFGDGSSINGNAIVCCVP